MTTLTLETSQFWFKVTSAIASLLVVAFIAWAGVIWAAWQDVSDRLFAMSTDVSTVAVKIETIADRLEYVNQELHEHENRPWHDEAGAALSRKRTELDGIHQRMNRMQDKLDSINGNNY